MSRFLFLTFLLASLNINAQQIIIEKTLHPYYDIFEWKGMGGILMSKDPSGNNTQINMTLVGSSTESIWDQKFAPRNKDYYFISSENARYVYFLHNLNPENGKIYFDQLNAAGNVKSTSVVLSSAIKKLGDFDINQLELKNVVVTDKALVHQFRYYNGKEKSFTEIATFMTHHNMLVYATILGTVPETLVKNNESYQWRYIGFNGDKICFATHEKLNNNRGWSVKEYSSKAELTSTIFLKKPIGNFATISNSGFGTTGSFYLKSENDSQSGLLTFHNDKFYLTEMSIENNQSNLILFELLDGEWKKINSALIESTSSKKSISLGVYPMNEGLGYHVISTAGDKTMALKYDGSSCIVNPFTEKTVYNPSRVLVSENKEKFAVILPDGTLFFDLTQFGKSENVEFQFVKK